MKSKDEKNKKKIEVKQNTWRTKFLFSYDLWLKKAKNNHLMYFFKYKIQKLDIRI